jgi:hypothetical protein
MARRRSNNSAQGVGECFPALSQFGVADVSLATTTMLFVLVSPCSNSHVTRTMRLATVLSDAHAGSEFADFGERPIRLTL